MKIIEALSAVMADVGAVRKDSKNQSQGFNFRGIDSVMNAVSPALRKHGVIVFPQVLSSEYDTVTIGSKGTQMGHCRVKVTYTFMASDGSNIEATVVAESMDSGDKATAKAMSVAFRTCLLQTLCLPTDELDPDAETFERAPKQSVKQRASAPAPDRWSDDAAIPRASTWVGTKKTEQFVPAEPDPAGEIARPGALTKTQKAWVEKQCFGRGSGDTLTEVSKVLGRTVGSLDEITEDDRKVLLPALSNGANDGR